jgi:site-specific DNA-methyltransferase (adenine-specific)/modification methylase
MSIRVECGDSLLLIPKLLINSSIPLVIADPPYNIAKNTVVVEFADKRYSSHLDAAEWDKFGSRLTFLDWMNAWINAVKPKLSSDASMYIFCASNYINPIQDICIRNGMEKTALLVWHKTNPAPRCFKTDFSGACEYIIYARQGKPTLNWQGERKMHNCITGPMCKNSERYGHPTQKPEWLISHLLEISSNEGDLVLDPFGGVGTVAACCARLKRSNITFEIDERYAKIAEERSKVIKKVWDIFSL